MTVLTTNSAIRRAVAALLGDSSRRRVVVSGFIGAGAEMWVPEAAGATIYCWDKPGGTNPEAVRELLRLKAKVLFVSYLHAKI